MTRWAWVAVRHVVFGGLCAFTVGAELVYRVPGDVLAILPWVGLVLLVSTVLLLAEHLLRRARIDSEAQRTVRWLDRVATALICGFFAYGLFLFSNGYGTSSPAKVHPAAILQLGRLEAEMGILPWADVRSWRDGRARERLLLHWEERRRLWGGQAVLIHVRQGYYGVPWVERIAPDEEAQLRAVLRVSPHASQAWKNLVDFLLRSTRIDEAAAMAFDYMAVYPNDVNFAIEFSRSMFNVFRYGTAARLLEPLKDRRSNVKLQQLLGFALTRGSRKAEGYALLERTIELQPDDWYTYYLLAYAHYYNGELKEAEPWFEKLVQIRADAPTARQRLLEIRARTKSAP